MQVNPFLWYDKKNVFCGEMHPADELRGEKSTKLSKKRIILGVTGSIAAVESVQLSRELIRHGADVIPVMTKAATRIIHPDALEFATGHKPIVELTGKTEHVFFCGLVKNPVDLLLVSPCTANTLSKIALGVDDTPVTTFATTAIGSGIPIILVPAMHLSMYHHRVFQQNIKKCKQLGIFVVNPLISKNKVRMPSVDDLVGLVFQQVGKNDLAQKKILVIGGGTAEPVDDIRVFTNRSSGKTAVSLATTAFERGATVELWYGNGSELVPSYISVKRFDTVRDLLNLVKNNQVKQFDCIIVCAAIANYLPKRYKGKIPSGKEKLILEFSPAPTVLQTLRSLAPKSKIIAFKAEEQKNEVSKKAVQLLKKHNLDGVIGNTLSAFGRAENEILIVTNKGKRFWRKGKKEDLAYAILDLIV